MWCPILNSQHVAELIPTWFWSPQLQKEERTFCRSVLWQPWAINAMALEDTYERWERILWGHLEGRASQVYGTVRAKALRWECAWHVQGCWRRAGWLEQGEPGEEQKMHSENQGDPGYPEPCSFTQSWAFTLSDRRSRCRVLNRGGDFH